MLEGVVLEVVVVSEVVVVVVVVATAVVLFDVLVAAELLVAVPAVRGLALAAPVVAVPPPGRAHHARDGRNPVVREHRMAR